MAAPKLKVVSINDRAIDNIRYIRETMERAGSFTAVPGWGGVAMGATAVVASVIASFVDFGRGWFAVWLAEATLAILIGSFAMVRKAGSIKALLKGPGRKFALGLCPAMACGAILTAMLYQHELYTLMPGVWLLLYGVAVVNGGTNSVQVVPMMGMAFMAMGAVALFLPFPWASGSMGLGFGVLHIVFGTLIARRYGG